MASPAILEFETLLAPIPGADPAGDTLSFEVRKKLDDLRKEINPDQYAPDDPRRPTQAQVADWAGIETTAKETLAGSCKDLLVATRLTEALVKLHGFGGLRDGLRLVRRLSDECWDRVHPAIRDGDAEAREGAYTWLDEEMRGARFPFTVRTIPLTNTKDGQKYSWQNWKETQDPKYRGPVTAQIFDQAAAGTPREHCQMVVEDLAECVGEMVQLQNVLNTKFGESSAPGFPRLRKAVLDCQELATLILQRKGPEPKAAAKPSETNGAAPVNQEATHAPAVLTREDILNRLAEACGLLLQMEPQSPIAYMVQRAVKLARLPLPDLMRVLVRDPGVLGQLDRDLDLGLESEKPNKNR